MIAVKIAFWEILHPNGASRKRRARGNVADMRPGPPPGGPPKFDDRISANETIEFQKTLATGMRRYAEMTADVKDRKFLSDEALAARRKTFDTHYRSAIPEDPDYRTDPQARSISIVDVPTAHYINAVDPVQGEIRAFANVNPKAESLPDWLLSGADVQYFQYEAAHAEHGLQQITPLRRIRRMNVASGTGSTLMTYMSRLNKNYIGMELTPGDQHVWETEGSAGTVRATTSDLFHAVLGTENAISAIWLVRDNGPRLGINGIQKVVVESGQNLAIYFSPA